MQPLTLLRPATAQAAIRAAQQPGAAYIAGGTDLLQLTKDNVETPSHLIDLETVRHEAVRAVPDGLYLHHMARMSDVAADPAVVRDYPVLSQALLASASPQVRNMGTMGGNILQRTRCGYFRDTGFACNKRVPGSGCPAIHGENRNLAILGVSEHCIATQPSDMAVALVALNARVELLGPNGPRTVGIEDFHRLPGDTPHIETVLQPGEMITGISIPATPMARRSGYVKVRDRASFEWAVVSAAVALQIEGGTIHAVRVAAGGVGTKPWRLPEVEAALTGKNVDADTLKQAAEQAGQGAAPASQNGFKPLLLRRTVLRALQTVTA